MEGNQQKMREALKTLLNLAYVVQDENSDGGPRTRVPEQFIIDVAKSALSAPPRNCDVMSIESARKVWFEKEIRPRLDGDLPLGKEIPFEDWFVSQQDQGEGDGS